jgi:hypothetical protein
MPDTYAPDVAIIGGGPVGLMAAEVLARAGAAVAVFEAKPSLGRKFLRAGVGGLNITHNEAYDTFCTRYGSHQPQLQAMLDQFAPASVRQWVHGLGIETFDGSSGKVFPVGMKAAPLLRAWVQRLRGQGVQFHLRHRWVGWGEHDACLFETPAGAVSVTPRVTVLALGGGSWPQLGSDAAWMPLLQARGVQIAPLQSANCGFNVTWSDHLRTKFAGTQLKAVALSLVDVDGHCETRRGEFIISRHGVEGSLVYAFAQRLRNLINARGQAVFTVDLLPDRTEHAVLQALLQPRGSRSLSSHLQSRLGLQGVKTALLHEVLDKSDISNMTRLAAAIKALPITVQSPRPLPEAISTAGGICFQALTGDLMLKDLPGVFAAGEMLDWEAPTGGYLLTACLAQGAWVGQGVLRWLATPGRASRAKAD